ncbi:MAG: protein translocase subunit SecD, partial [Proteobacteria bacterium]|nr:protein translocase subunit SecD [Pseudomonadota bacterium]
MQNKYPLWKNILLVVIAIFGILYALPNLYGDDPSVQISAAEHKLTVDANVQNRVQKILEGNHLTYKALEKENNNLLIRFANTDSQLKAKDLLSTDLGEDYTVASSLAPATPHWLSAIHAHPMKYGLDLRGGVHFLLKVDVDGVVERRENGLIKGLTQELRQKRIRYASIDRYQGKGILLRFRDVHDRDDAANLVRTNYQELMIENDSGLGDSALLLKFTPVALHEMQQYTVEQTMTVLRNRVNELGVEEPMVQQQGPDRIAVDLPGLQDASRAQQILGGTATV